MNLLVLLYLIYLISFIIVNVKLNIKEINEHHVVNLD